MLLPYQIERVEKGIDRVLKTRSTNLYFPSPADIIAEVVEIEPEQKLLAAPKPEEDKPLTPEEQTRYLINWAFTLQCLKNFHTPPGGIEGWKRERDQFAADVASGKIKLARHKTTGNLMIDSFANEFKDQRSKHA